MTAKEKAKEIYDKMKGFRITNSHIKKCALVCVQEIFDLGVYWNTKDLAKDYPNRYGEESTYEFWEEVKAELEKL